MKIKFLVVLAVICLFAHHVSASGMKAEEKKNDAAPKPVPAPKPKEEKPVKPESSEYEIEIIHHKAEKTVKKEKEKKTHVEVKKEVKKKVKKEKTCEETLKEERADCEKSCSAGFKPVFTLKEDGKYCDWECNYEALPPPPGQKEVKKEKKIVTVTKAPKPKAPKKLKKECSGEKVIKFENCLVKVRGLIAFGDKTRNFDKKFAKLVAKKQKKGAKKAKKGKKGGPKPAAPAPAASGATGT
ncbi:hypothetical protein ACKWTF_006039 [Chironomus riparius]